MQRHTGIPVSIGLGPTKTTYNDDIIEGWVGVGSQLDGLGHIGVEHVYYNGNKLADFADPTGLKKLGVEGKALLVDVKPEDRLALSVRNIEGVRLLASNRISARDVMDTRRVVLTQAALEKLQEALG